MFRKSSWNINWRWENYSLHNWVNHFKIAIRLRYLKKELISQGQKCFLVLFFSSCFTCALCFLNHSKILLYSSDIQQKVYVLLSFNFISLSKSDVWKWREILMVWNIKLNEKNVRKLILSVVQNLMHCEALFILLLIHTVDDINKDNNSIFYLFFFIYK